MTGELQFGEDDGSAALRRAWDLSLHMLANKVSKVTFETFIRPVQPLQFADHCIRLGVASPYNKDWLEKKAANAIRSALEFHLDVSELRVEFVVLSRESRNVHDAGTRGAAKDAAADTNQIVLPLDCEAVTTTAAPEAKPAVSRGRGRRTGDAKPVARADEKPPIPCLSLNAEYVLENFIVGPSNRLAHAGALEVAERPGEVYNPLFVYSQPGLGKTHLLQGIAQALRRTKPGLRVAYVSGEYFAQHFIAAVRDHVTESFRRQYRETDVWLVDDIHFIAGKELTKEEFFHTFNSLHQNNKQIVIGSDRSPRELTAMDERLRTRFQGGLIADIAAPELETRVAILRQRRDRDRIPVPDEVLVFIAGAIQSNMRALEGALTKLVAYSSVMNVPINADLARSVLKEYYIEKRIPCRRLTVDDVIDAVAQAFGGAAAAIKGPNRNKDVALARHVAMYLCRELLPEVKAVSVGTAFGGRDHATVVHACKKLQALMNVDTDMQEIVKQLKQTLLRVQGSA